MKKKLILTICVLVFCSLIFIFARGLEQKYSVKNSNNSVNTKVESSKQENIPQTSSIAENSKESSTTVVSKESGTSSPKASVQSSGDNKTVSNTAVNTSTSPKPVLEPPKVQAPKPNFLVIDTIANKTVFSTNIDFNNEDVGKVTLRVLDGAGIRYKAGGIGSSIYFSMIADLKERSEGPSSGWCYYINGEKPGISAGSYKVGKDDTIEWRFLKDGL